MAFYTRGSRAGFVSVFIILLINASCANTWRCVCLNRFEKASFNSPPGKLQPVLQNDLLSISVSGRYLQARRVSSLIASKNISTPPAYYINRQRNKAFLCLNEIRITDLRRSPNYNPVAECFVEKKLQTGPAINIISTNIAILWALSLAGEPNIYALSDDILYDEISIAVKVVDQINKKTI